MSDPLGPAGLSPEARASIPRSHDGHHPKRWALRRFRWFGAWGMRRRYDVRVHGQENIPATGPVIIACNHVGILDGPLLAIFAPRPVHALTKHEMFTGAMGRFLLLVGQIPLERTHSDLTAVKNALHVLRAGGVLGIYPEGTRGDGEFTRFHNGAAYYAMVTGAPVVPAVMIGTREPGGGPSSLPPRHTRIDIVFGEQFHVDPVPWPRRREQVDQVARLMQKHLRVHLDHALALTGRSLPGPLPPKEQSS